MSPVKLYRAPHRGAEGAGVAVVWSRVEDVSDFDGAMDAIVEGGDAWMFRLAHEGKLSVWSTYASRPDEIFAPQWLAQDNPPLQRGECDWIDVLPTVGGAPIPHLVEAIGVLSLATGVRVALDAASFAWRATGLDTPCAEVLRGLDAWCRGEATAASLESSIAQIPLWMRETQSLEVYEAEGAVHGVARAIQQQSRVEAAACLYFAVQAARKSHRLMTQRYEGPSDVDACVRARLTPELVFDAFRLRETADVSRWPP